MKMSRVVLVLGFVLIMALYSDARPKSLNVQCCFKFFHGKIPPQHVLKVEKTDPRCPQQGFIVTTPKFPNLCVREDPREESTKGSLYDSRNEDDTPGQCAQITH